MRLLSIVALLLGVLTIGLTLGVLIQRQGSSPPEIVLVTALDPHQARMRVYRVAHQAEHEVWLPLGQVYDGLTTWGVSPNGQWLYLRGYRKDGSSNEHMTLRLHLDGLHIEPLPNIRPASTLFWTPDGQWMIYKGVDELTGGTPLWQATPDGKIIQNLTLAIITSPNIDVPSPPIISPENDWVAFNGFDIQNEVYVAAGGKATQITRGGYATYLRGHVRNATGDWLIVSKVDGAYRMRLDGTELTRLLPNEPIVADIVYFWPEARLLLIQRDKAEDILYALSMEDFSVQWSMPDSYLALWQPSQPYRMVAADRMLQVFPDGTSRKIMNLLPGTQYHYSADGTMIYFAHVEGRSATSAITDVLRSVTLADDELRTVHISDYLMNFLDWPNSAGWFLFEQGEPVGQSIWRVWEASGRTERLVSKRPYDRFLGVGRLRDSAMDGLPLIGGGGVLVIGGVLAMSRRSKS